MPDYLTFDMLRAGIDQFEKIRRDNYPPKPEYDAVYKSFLVGQIYKAMKEQEDGRS